MADISKIKSLFPRGSRVKLSGPMVNDPNPVPVGTLGTVDYVDDVGTVFVKWDSGQILGAIYGVDKIIRVDWTIFLIWVLFIWGYRGE